MGATVKSAGNANYFDDNSKRILELSHTKAIFVLVTNQSVLP